MLMLFIGTLGLIIGLLQALIYRRQLQVLRWNQALKTMEMAEQWVGPNLTSVRTFASQYYDYTRAEPVDIERLKADPDWPKISASFMTLLNYFDLVSIACMRRIADEELCYTILYFVFTKHLRVFGPFIEDVRRATHDQNAPIKAWGCYEGIAKNWAQLFSEHQTAISHGRQATWYNIVTSHVMDSADPKGIRIRFWPFRGRKAKSF